MFCLGLKYTCLFAASLSPDSAQLRLVKDPVEMLPMQLIFFCSLSAAVSVMILKERAFSTELVLSNRY